MPIEGIYGLGGSGKNTILTYLIKRNKHLMNFKKYVNFTLRLPNTEKINSDELFDIEDTDEPTAVFWDEAYTEDLDSRDSMTDENKVKSYLLFQARKNNMMIVSIAQLNILDLRFRELQENVLYCYPRKVWNSDFTPYRGDFHYCYLTNTGKRIKFGLKYSDAEKVFPYFSTHEKILPKDLDFLRKKSLMKNPENVKLKVKEIADVIKKNCDIEKLTHDGLKYAMLDNNFINYLSLEKLVYITLKGKRI